MTRLLAWSRRPVPENWTVGGFVLSLIATVLLTFAVLGTIRDLWMGR